MEKLPTIILPAGAEGEAAFSPRRASPSSSLSLPHLKTQQHSSGSLLRLGGIRLRCSRPQQLIEDFYMKRLGMQQLSLVHAAGSKAAGEGEAEPLEFRLLLPPRQQLQQLLLQQGSMRMQQQQRRSSRNDLSAALAEGISRRRSSLRDSDACSSRLSSRRTSFGSQASTLGSAAPAEGSRFAAFEFFSSSVIEERLNEAIEAGDAREGRSKLQLLMLAWLSRGFPQFILECVPVKKLQGGLFKPYEHRRSDVFSRLSFCVSDVNAAALSLSQHMIRVQQAGQFLDLSFAASFLDPRNFRGRLLQHMSEYKMATRKAREGLKASTSSLGRESAGRALSPRSEKRSDPAAFHEQSEWSAAEGEAADCRRSSFFKSTSSVSSGAQSLNQAEQEGCLPAPSPDEMLAVESEEASAVVPAIRFDTLPLEGLPVLHHIELLTADAERSLAFYEEALGMTLIDKKTAHGFGFTLYFLAFSQPSHTSYRYWLWLQRFSCLCLRAPTDGSKVSAYKDLEPTECGFLGLSFLCPEASEQQLLQRLEAKKVSFEFVEDDVYKRKVLLLRDPQNVPIRIVLTG
ncbi:hypothetical protein Efla_002674 [Eimeria flavescens]